MDHEHGRTFVGHRHDRGAQADANDVLEVGVAHGSSRTSGSSTQRPSATMSPRPMARTASIMRPSRASALSAWLTRSGLGNACGASCAHALRDLLFEAGTHAIAKQDIGRRHRTADAGPAMHEHRRVGIPCASERQKLVDMMRFRRHFGGPRFRHVVHREPQMPRGIDTVGRLDHVLRRKQRHEMRRAIKTDRFLHRGKRRDEDHACVLFGRGFAKGERSAKKARKRQDFMAKAF